jgi:Enoyl-(Acyl carrier protein) reductase/Thioesterase superfamily
MSWPSSPPIVRSDPSWSTSAHRRARRGLSKEVGPHGVRVNTVSPGPVTTDLWLGAGGVAETVARATGGNPDEVAKQAASGMATGRFTTPREVADLVLLLASDRAGNVTGRFRDRRRTRHHAVRQAPRDLATGGRRWVRSVELQNASGDRAATPGPAGHDQFQTTLQLSVSFLRPVRPGRIVGKGRVVHRDGDTVLLSLALRSRRGGHRHRHRHARVIPLSAARDAA